MIVLFKNPFNPGDPEYEPWWVWARGIAQGKVVGPEPKRGDYKGKRPAVQHWRVPEAKQPEFWRGDD